MPIQLVCSTCGKRLQVGDQYAGRKVACPGCKTVITAPGGASPAAPAGSGTVPKPAPKPAAPPPPPPPPPREPAPVPGGDLFEFGSTPTRGDRDDEPSPPPRKPAGPPPARKDAPPPRGRGRDDDDDSPPPRRGGRGGRPAPNEKPGAKAWKSFGGGCGLAKWGMWIEFLALASGLAVFGYVVTGILEATTTGNLAVLKTVDDLGGPLTLAPFFVGTAFGSMLVLFGRTRMMGVPKTAGVKKVLFGAWAFALIRFLLVGAAAGLLLSAGSQWAAIKAGFETKGGSMPDGFLHFVLAFLAFAVSTPFLVLADLSTIPAMAVVGGEIPSERVRRRASAVTFILQLLVFAYVIVGALGGVAGSAVASHLGTAAAATTAKPDTAAKSALVVSLGVLLLAQFAYTMLFASLFSAGKKAVAEAREDEEAAEDEDV